ncbi:MAG: hypothetical protein QXV32_09575 [Conexivisphaerales archaeon]
MFSKEFSVAVMVKDARKSVQWYKEKLHMESSVAEHWVTVWNNGSNWKIHLCEGNPEPGNTGIALYTDDLTRLAGQLKKENVRFVKDVTKESWGTYAQISDLDGNIIWLIEGSP